MSEFYFRKLPLALLVVILVWSSSSETCDARRGMHWRQNKGALASLYKNKGKNHGGSSHHQGNGNKVKPKKPPSTKPPPSPIAPPPPPPPEIAPSPEVPLLPAPGPAVPIRSSTFDVLDYGAKGDGISDDSKAFQATWTAACEVEASLIIVPSDYEFLVGPVTFDGSYCQKNIIFQLDGTIIASTNSKAWGSGLLQWLEFKKLVGITIQGNGIIDGRGSVWWQDSTLDGPIDDEAKLVIQQDDGVPETLPIISSFYGKLPSIKPTALRFYGSFNVTVTGITIQNSPQCHLKFDSCSGVSVYRMSISSPGDSPNTDGIHLQNSNNVLIHTTNLACGDDCISIQTGCTNVFVRDVNCGPGHGISIGSLGKDGMKACVSNITVRDINMSNTMNGVRIKTWQGGEGSVKGVLFSNIQISEVEVPIVIDQYYCDKSKCRNQTSAVALSGITYERIKGTYTVKPVHLSCSDSMPCMDVTLNDIELKPMPKGYHMYDPFCWQAFGELFGPTFPEINCLQEGQPPSSWNPEDGSC